MSLLPTTMIASSNSASRLSNVCETSVPATTGSDSRIRPMRRATISAREGSPRRAGSVADINTPMEVALRIVRRFTGRSGSAARRMWNHETARRNIEVENSPSAISTQIGLECSSVVATLSKPTRRSARKASSTPMIADSAERGPPQTRQARASRAAPWAEGARSTAAGARAGSVSGRAARAPP